MQKSGRDIGPLLVEYGKFLDENYEIHGHLHTKKSLSIDNKGNDGRKWRKYLYGNLIGTNDYQMLDIIVSHMNAHKYVGLVFPDDPNCIGWTDNADIVKKISREFEIEELPRAFNFPMGTMYWARKVL